MRGTSTLRIGAILKIGVRNPGIRGVAEGPEIGKPKHECPAIEVFARVWQIYGSRQRQIVRDVRIGIVHLLGEAVAANILIQLESRTSFVSEGVLIERGFKGNKAGRHVGIEYEIQVATLKNALG